MKYTSYAKRLSLFFVIICPFSVMAKADEHGNNQLMLAAKDGDSKKVGRLLLLQYNSAKKINAINKDGNTALMLAAMNGRTSAIRKLLSYNVIDIDIRNEDGQSALDLAEAGGHTKAAELIRNHKKGRVVRPRAPSSPKIKRMYPKPDLYSN